MCVSLLAYLPGLWDMMDSFPLGVTTVISTSLRSGKVDVPPENQACSDEERALPFKNGHIS